MKRHKFFNHINQAKRIKHEKLQIPCLSRILSYLSLPELTEVQYTSIEWRDASLEASPELSAASICHKCLVDIDISRQSMGQLKSLQKLLKNRVSHLRSELLIQKCQNACPEGYQLINATHSDIYLFNFVVDDHQVEKYQREDYYLTLRVSDKIFHVMIRKNKYGWTEKDGTFQYLQYSQTDNPIWKMKTDNLDPYAWNMCVEVTDESEEVTWSSSDENSLQQLLTFKYDLIELIYNCCIMTLSEEYFIKLISDVNSESNGIKVNSEGKTSKSSKLIYQICKGEIEEPSIPFNHKFGYMFYDHLLGHVPEYYEQDHAMVVPKSEFCNPFHSWKLPVDVVPLIFEFLPEVYQPTFSAVNTATRRIYEKFIGPSIIAAVQFAQKSFGNIEATEEQLRIFCAMPRVLQIRFNNLEQDVFELECMNRYNNIKKSNDLPFEFNLNVLHLETTEMKPLHKRWEDVAQAYFALITQNEQRSVLLQYRGDFYTFAFTQMREIWCEQNGTFRERAGLITDANLITYDDRPDKWKMIVHVNDHMYTNVHSEHKILDLPSFLLEMVYIAMKIAGYSDGHFKHAFQQIVNMDRCPRWAKDISDSNITPTFDRLFHYTFYEE